MVKLTPQEVLARLRQAAQTGAFILSLHAMRRANERCITRKDVVKAFHTAKPPEQEENDRWQITGLDEDGNELKVIVDVGDRIKVITVFAPSV